MGPKSYQVIVYTEHCEGEPGVIARELATLSEQPESSFLKGLSAGLVIFQRELSYDEAVEYKELLDNRGISAQIRRGTSEVREKQSLETVDEIKIASFLDDADIFGVESEAENDLIAGNPVAGGWNALFPDLAENIEKAPRPAAKRAVLKSDPKAEAVPAISSWQPALDTQEGVVASVPVAKTQKPDVVRVEKPVEKRPARIESTEKIDELKKSRVFAGTVLAEAAAIHVQTLGPYAPTGFDPRPAHVPLLAAVFSGFAPGAGQIYNGQEEAALKYGMRFWWIRPWIASVRQAHEFGIKVRDYQEPRPADASLGRALRYAAGWYLVVILFAGLIVFGVSATWDLMAKQEQVVVSVDIGDVVERAVRDIQFARMSSNTAVNKYLDEQNKSKQEFTMSVEERAHRLYVIGYSYCVGRQYNLCEATMRRVTSLGVRNRDAYRLQAWASMQIQERDKTPMPEIDEVPTLFELELHQENDPDRDIVQPALDLMRDEQGANEVTKALNEANEVD